MSLRDALEFFDELVKNRPGRRDPVRLFIMGTKKWQDFAQWPPPADQQKWYLGQGGTLSPDAVKPGPADRYRYDPADPTPGPGGASLMAKNAGPKDQASREQRSDVVTYTSAPLQRDLTVVGPLTATLHLSLELGAHRLRGAAVRCLAQGEVDQPQRWDRPLDSRRGEEKEGRHFRAGHLHVADRATASKWATGCASRCRVVPIRCSPATWAVVSGWARAPRWRAADQEIWHDETHQSFITLPVLGGSK